MKIWDGKIGEESVILQIIPVLADNYCYVLSWEGKAIVVDPGEAGPVIKLIQDESLQLEAVFATHHHDDHIDGVKALREACGGRFLAPDDNRIKDVDQTFNEDEELFIGPFAIKVFKTPGHTKTHISLFFLGTHFLFCGDVLFSNGCGKLLEGTYDELFHSIEGFKSLPGDSLVLCGHENSLTNTKFSLTVDPDNVELKKRLKVVEHLRSEGLPTIPTTLGFEMRTNPFMRCGEKSIRQQLKMVESSDLEVFTKLRQLKDAFKG